MDERSDRSIMGNGLDFGCTGQSESAKWRRTSQQFYRWCVNYDFPAAIGPTIILNLELGLATWKLCHDCVLHNPASYGGGLFVYSHAGIMNCPEIGDSGSQGERKCRQAIGGRDSSDSGRGSALFTEYCSGRMPGDKSHSDKSPRSSLTWCSALYLLVPIFINPTTCLDHLMCSDDLYSTAHGHFLARCPPSLEAQN